MNSRRHPPELAGPQVETAQPWLGIQRIGLELPYLRRVSRRVAEPFTPAALDAAHRRKDPETRAALAAVQAAVLRIGSSLDELLMAAFRRSGRKLPASELAEAWRWALGQEHGVPASRAAEIERAAATARRLAGRTHVSAAALHQAVATFDREMADALCLICAGWSTPGHCDPLPRGDAHLPSPPSRRQTRRLARRTRSRRAHPRA